MRFKPYLILIIYCLVFLTACGGANYAPVDDRANRAYKVDNHYVVSQGETLFSIAWRYGIDYKQLATANGIVEPYTIYSGQRILLKAEKSASAVAVKKAKAPESIAANKPRLAVKKTSQKSVKKAANSNLKKLPFRWVWPSAGRLTERFSLSGTVHKGIDLAGKLRESVIAANSGKVVYAGSGLVGYGKLLIIKHNDRFLSAYGHNHKLLVSEGQLVKAGQAIAEMGNTGTNVVKLHFEIRRDGKPVDPMKYLPKRA